jgi:NADPH2:quinone reductase
MQAVVSHAPDQPLERVTLPSRPLARDEVRVKVRAIGVNPVDWKMREGGPLRLARDVVGPRGPLVVGVDFAGEVMEVGPAGGPLEVGARVVGGTDFSRKQLGSYADEVVVRPDQCAVIPDAVSFEAAACLPVAAVTPWITMTEHTRIGPDRRVLVLGASGGVGLFALQLVRMLGGQAVGVCSSRNTAIVERFGAVAIDYTLGEPLEAAREHGPYDLVLHCIGTDVYPLAACRALLTKKGVVDLVVVRPADYLTVAFHGDVTTVLGKPTKARLEPLVDALEKGALEPVIEATYPLAEAEAAHQRSRAGKVVGKLLLIP